MVLWLAPGVALRMRTTTVQFGAWMPDDDRNIAPGAPGEALTSQNVPLEVAKNVLYTGNSWRLYKPLSASGSGLVAIPRDGITLSVGGVLTTFCAAGGLLYKIVAGTPTDISKTGGYNQAAPWSFTQFADFLIATNGTDAVQYFDTTASTAFADLAGSPPKGGVVGVVRDFVVLGDVTDGNGNHPYRVQWSGLANATKWPAPLTQDARAYQSGYQDCYSDYGKVQYVAQGEEFGMVFQERGIVRMSYVGGDAVFSFFTFERKRGLVARKAAGQHGETVYFLSGDGFYATNGQEVRPIGYGVVNRWFLDNCADVSKVRCAVDAVTQCVYWAFPSTASGVCDRVIVFNFAENQWSYAEDTTYALFQGLDATSHVPQAFNANAKLGNFTGNQYAGELQTKNFRLQPSMRCHVKAARVLADDAAQVSVSATGVDDDEQVFSPYASRNSRSGSVPLRANNYIHALRVRLGANTTYAQGLEVDFDTRSQR